MSKKIVQITESELVNLIENIVTETVTDKKKEWLAESKQKSTTLLESKITELEGFIKKLVNEVEGEEKAWYMKFQDIKNLEKYPEDFIDWVKQDDTWAETYTHKEGIKTLKELYIFWKKEGFDRG